jgi:hypothetical protein
LTAVGAGAAAAAGSIRGLAAQAPIPIEVYKDPNCGCCGSWVAHMNANGFKATVHDGPMEPVHAKYKIPANLQSCHLGVVRTFLIEGHVPAADVKKLLRETPKGIVGLAIPGMPQSAPGMDAKPFQPYTVLAFDAQRKTSAFAAHTKA